MAEKAAVYKIENLASLTELRAWIWGEPEEPYEATGSLGILRSDNKDFEIQKEAKLLSPDGYLFQTTLINYEAARKRFYGSESVLAEQVSSRGPSPLKMTGDGFSVDLNKAEYEIQKNVRAFQRLPTGDVLDVRSQRALMLGNDRLAFFLRKVVVKSPQFELSGERLRVDFEKQEASQSPKAMTLDSPGENKSKAKKITAKLKQINIRALGLVVSFAEDGQMSKTEAVGEVDADGADGVRMRADKLESLPTKDGQNQVLMKGHVTIVANNRTATCEEAEYVPEIGQIILRRVASIKRDRQLLEGDLIRFSTKNSEIFVEKARGQMEKKEAGF